MLELKALRFSYGEDDYQFDLSIDAHSTTAIMGKSGSGKSTLLNLIAGFLKPSSGNIQWQKSSLLTLPAQRRPITTLFQQHNLFPHLTIHQNLALGINPSLKLSKEQEQQLTNSLDAVGMTGMDGQSAHTLSGGEQQRVALARCLLRQKPILLMDEPFSALDEATRESMQALTRETIKNNKLCAIIVTHSHNDAVALDASTCTLVDGRLSSLI
ncbi:MAG: ATP-binding cassette domain-containing protein [Granulosicoccaceae bacterium]